MASEVTILVADDHPLLRAGLRQAIEADRSLRVVAEAGDGETALEQLAAVAPDVAVIDLDMPKLDGFGVLRVMRARGSETAAIVLTLHADDRLLFEAIDLGAQGYLLKDSALTEIVDGIKAVAAGRQYVSASLTPLLLRHRSRVRTLAARQPGLADLTPGETRILRLIAEGRSSKEIAGTLCIHYRTVENHRVNIAQKLGLHGHNAVLKWALEHKHEL
jgi:DNA-binding NarL/FixJ family response regulator